MLEPPSQPEPVFQRPVFVTGGAGFIGSRVVRRLVRAGHTVRCLLRASSRTERTDDLPIERAAGDVLDAESVARAAAGCGAVIHLAGVSAWMDIDSPRVVPVTVDGTANVLAAARKHDIPRVVFVSSAAAFGPSESQEPRDEDAPFVRVDSARFAYVVAKRAAEKLCLGASVERTVVVVNPAEVYGPGDRDLITAGNLLGLLASRPVAVCRGGTCVAHVDDVAEGIVRALERGRSGNRYLLGGENLTHETLARALLRVAGRRSSVVRIPNWLLRTAATAARRLSLSFPVSPAVIPYATRYWFFDTRKARDELGLSFRPAEETLAETVDWLRTAGHLR